jgi:GNAT superfamily N-acetyltransferase
VSETAVRVEPLAKVDMAAAVRVLGVKPGDRGVQFAADITGERRQLFVAKANGQVVAYGWVLGLAAGEAAPGTSTGCYLGGILVEPAWRGRGIATALTQARLRWAFARTGTVFYVTGADNAASLHLHAALGFHEVKRLRANGPPSAWTCCRGSSGRPTLTIARSPATGDRILDPSMRAPGRGGFSWSLRQLGDRWKFLGAARSR